jgi:hypothetical protein
VLEARVRNVVREALQRMPEDTRRQLRDALGHLPPERRGQLLAEVLGEDRRDPSRPPKSPDRGPRVREERRDGPRGDRTNREPKARDGKREPRPGPETRGPRNRPGERPEGDRRSVAPPRGRGESASPGSRPPRRSRIEQLIRGGIQRLPEPARRQVEDRLGRVLPRLRESRGAPADEVRRRFRDALEREFLRLSPEQQTRILEWAHGEVG